MIRSLNIYGYKCLLTIFAGIAVQAGSVAQISAFYSSALFHTPQNQNFVETYLAFAGKSLGTTETNGKLHNSVNVAVSVLRDSVIVAANKYNILGPSFSGTAIPVFIDNQRYLLPNGSYDVRLVLRDNYDTVKEPMVISDKISVNFNDNEIQSSGIQVLESYKRTSSNGPFTKSGFELVPYTVNYYPESKNELSFYFECYNTDIVLGENKPLVFNYYLETANDVIKLNSFGSFKKVVTSRVNPILAKMDISTLGSGDYNLVIELKDQNNGMQIRKKYFFQRKNKNVDIAELQKHGEKEAVAEYFGQCNNSDTLKMFVECLWPIADGIDKERIINQSLGKDNDLMKKFVVDFWKRRAADTANPIKMWAAYYQEVQKVMTLFKCGKQKGYYTERGRVYLQYGAPNQRAQQTNEQNTFPYEIWQYYRITDAVNGQFYTNRKFVFVNKMLGDDCYTLIHSDMRGEIYNPRWQFELTRRNNNGMANPDNNVPAGTEHNQFNDMYSNPR